MMNNGFRIDNDGNLVEYLGEPKRFTVFRDGDIVAKISSYFKDNLQTVTVPGYVRKIGFYAFKDCSLKTIYFEEGVQSLELGCFWHCDCLEDIYFPHSLKQVSPDAFPVRREKVAVHVDYVAGLWPALRAKKWLIRNVDKELFDRYAGVLIAMKLAYKKAIKLVLHIRSDVKDNEFNGFPVDCQAVIEEDIPSASRIFQCSAISKVTIGRNVQVLNPDVFSGGNEYYEDTSLEEFSVDPQNNSYYCLDGVLFNAKDELVRFPQMKLMDKNTYYVPTGTTAICDGAFSWAYGLENIYIGPDVEIRCNSFANTPKLDKVYRETGG